MNECLPQATQQALARDYEVGWVVTRLEPDGAVSGTLTDFAEAE
jgi:hypothetical protein